MRRRFEPFADEEFQRCYKPRIPMTNFETRAVITAKLSVKPDDLVIDIGAGTGSLSLEAARLAYGGKVIAVEKNPAAAGLIAENAQKLDVKNVSIIHARFGEATRELNGIQADKIIIGGSGGELKEIIEWSGAHCKTGGRVCAVFVTLENAALAVEAFKRIFGNVDTLELISARGKQIGSGLTMMLSNNPVYILSARKEGVV